MGAVVLDEKALTLVVLAAGIGSRYGGLKQIDPVGPNGEIIIDYSVYDALEAGFGRVVFVVREELQAAFRDRVGRSIERRCETVYVFQKIDDLPQGAQIPPGRQKPWGTAHATWGCRGVVDGPFGVINADDFYGRSAFQSLYEHLRSVRERNSSLDFCMIGYPLENTLTEHGSVARGICTVTTDGYLKEVLERTQIQRFGPSARYTVDGETWVDIPPGTTASMNIWGFTPDLFPELGTRFLRFLRENMNNLKSEFFLPEVVQELIRERRAKVKVLPANEQWFGVTHQQDRPRVQHTIQYLIRRGSYPENLWGDNTT